ncbi:MAG: nicotinamidase-related amidase [Paracoccaceae bacterium]
MATNAARLLNHARAQGDMVVHVRHQMPSADAPFFRPGTTGAEINASVAPIGDEPVIVKARPNSFAGTDLFERLQKADIQSVDICGAMSQMYIDAATRAAVDFGIQVSVAKDACGAKEMTFGIISLTAEQVHAAFMAPLAMSYAQVVSTEELVSPT